MTFLFFFFIRRRADTGEVLNVTVLDNGREGGGFLLCFCLDFYLYYIWFEAHFPSKEGYALVASPLTFSVA